MFMTATGVVTTNGFGQRAIHNDSDKPIAISEVVIDGRTMAHLYVPAHGTLEVNAKGGPDGGAGYYEAVPGSYMPIRDTEFVVNPTKLFGGLCFASFRVGKVLWGEHGELVAITGLQPTLYLEMGTDKRMTSNVEKPKIANGNLYFMLGSTTEYWAKIRFGRIVGLGKTGDQTELDKPKK
jgi:hypothetical protein